MNALRWLYRPRLIKCLLLLVFLANLGLVEALQRLPKDFSPLSREEQLRRNGILSAFVEEKLTLAKGLILQGQIYSPYHYFADLKAIKDREQELKVRLEGLNPSIGELQKLAENSLNYGFSNKDFEKAIKNYREYLQTGGKNGDEATEKFRQHIQQMGLSGILLWVLLLYLKCLPLAFILFLIWAKEGQLDDGQFKFPRPLRFGLMVSFYPIVMAYVFYQWFKIRGRQIWTEAELRRTKQNLFTFLSDEEVKRIRNFARSTATLSCWREQLRHRGLKPRHSLAAALIVTLFFILLPVGGKADETAKKTSHTTNIRIEQLYGQHLPRMSIGDEHSSIGWPKGESDAAITPSYDLVSLMLIRWLAMIKIVFQPQEVFSKIDHIPISAIQSEVYFTKTLTE